MTLISTAALAGAVAYAAAIRFFLNPRKHFPVQNSVAEKKPCSRSPFDPSKRKGLGCGMNLENLEAYIVVEVAVGACLVSQDGIILERALQCYMSYLLIFMGIFSWSGIGYNGFPRGCSDDKLPWSKKSKTGDPLETKYPYVCHAEVNAILNTNHASAAGQTLYITMFPCNECAKIIIQSGVSEVIYFVEKRLDNSGTAYVASHKLLSMAGVKVRRHQPQMDQIFIKFQEP
ncbi:hypothetical protein RJ639_026987 [Escallonia herrerae]|uniref:dCMP deaminase n=1 Tax=Escallonia herrerae TaxID=1293975 RepID=A0AA89BQT5_9ASTE|nr:hypothetical protein RJ639_026987 [Escallonia herrerae]